MSQDPAWPTPDDARRHLRSSTQGVLLSDGVPARVRFIVDGLDGRLVLPVEAHTLDASEHVLAVPDDGLDAMELLVTLTPDDDEEARDRFMAYHARATGSRWIRAAVDSAKWAGAVFDGETILGPNRVRADEPRLCRTLNADRARLARLCERGAGVRPESPVAVGVDGLGVDVRARFGVVRVDLPREARDADDLLAMIDVIVGSEP